MFDNGHPPNGGASGGKEAEVVTTMRTAVGYPAAHQLLRRAQLELDAADASADPQTAFLHAHMGAIRTASAVLAIAPGAPRRRRRVLSVWEQLAEAGPAWERWAATFAAGAPVRAAIEAGRLPELDERVAAVALDSARDFHDEVRATVREAETVAVPSLAS